MQNNLFSSSVFRSSFFWLATITVFIQGVFLITAIFSQNKNTKNQIHFAKHSTVKKDTEQQSSLSQQLFSSDNKETSKTSIREKTETLQEQLPDAFIEVETVSTPEKKQDRYRVKHGDTLTGIWVANGGSYAGGLQAAHAFRAAKISLSTLTPGEILKIETDESGIYYFEKKLKAGKKFILRRSEDLAYDPEIYEPEIHQSKRAVAGEIIRSFSTAAEEAAIPPTVSDEFVDLFGGRIEFNREVHRGDSYTVIYEERRTEEGEELSPGPIQAASIHTGGKFLVAVRHKGADNEVRYYDEDGKPVGNYFLRYPVRYSRISSVFSGSRFHPILKRRRAHNGVDFAAPTGTPVRSVADGVIVSSGWNGGAGKMVKVKHSSKYSTAYLHLSRIEKGMTRGARIKRGQVIGKVGSTGYATGPHLHYSFYINGRYVDPLKVKLPTMPEKYEEIPTDKLQATLAALNKAHQTILVKKEEPSQLG